MKNVIQKILMLLGIILFGRTPMTAQADVTGYETVTVSIPATAYDAGKGAPQMARVKYNKTFPLVITSDDMGKTELTNNWAEVNGYPNVNNTIDLGFQPGGTKFLAAPYKKYYTQHESQDVNNYKPMTYTDNVGKQQRYRMTSAIMPYDVNSNNYAKINAEDAKLMLRTGWSFAQHDVDKTSSVENISTAMTNNSNIWANKVGIGLKVMVEPNGNHQYLDAGRQNSGVCWNIFQNAATGHPFNSRAINDWTHNRTDWTATGVGTMPTTFSSKPEGGYARSFFQGHESEWKNEVNNADGTKIIIGGTHGLGDEIKQHLRTAANVKDNAWVASADEVWEYYNIYNNVKIGEATFKDGKLTFDVQVPTYKKNQYRELTLNIPGLTGGEAPTFTNKQPVTGGYKQTTDAAIGYTMNIGLESSINEYINELMTIFRDDQTNEFVKRDIRYLASQLWDDSDCIASLDAAPVYSHTINARLDGTSDSDYPLAMIMTDTDGDKSFRIPRYVAKNGSLYETDGAAEGPKYAKTIATADTSSDVDYAKKNLDSSVVLYAEGEDLEGTTVIGADLEYNEHQDGRYYATNVASMGMAGSIVSSKPATVSKTLPRGKYKITVGYGESYKSQGTYNYHVKVGDTQVYTFANSGATDKAVTEFTSSDFNVEQDNTPVTITTDNTNADSRWIDYVYVQKTADLAAIAPTMTFTSSTTASTIKTGTTATLTANALPNGGSNLTTSIYASDSEGKISGSPLATGVESASYAFTPDAAGTSYFLAQSENSAGVTNSELIALTATDITTYTLNIVDKSGNTAMTATIDNPGSQAQADPLPDAYRSPFAENYHYYLTAEDAKNNNTANALNNTDAWTNATIYVGYDVKTSEFNSSKKFTIYNVNHNKYMHAMYRTVQSHVYDQLWNMRNQNRDREGGNTGITATTLAFIDNSFAWNLGDDPYNVQMLNLGSKRYVWQGTGNNNYMDAMKPDIGSASHYSIVYYNGNTSAGEYELYFREAGKFVYHNSGNEDWRYDNERTEGKLKIVTLPELNINIVDASGNVECTIHGYFKSGAAMPNFTPFFLNRTYTSNHRYYYNAACTDAVTADGTTAVDAVKIQNSNYNVYVKYDLSSDWNTDNLFKVSTVSEKYWYAIRFGNNNYLNAATTGDHAIGSAGSNTTTSTTADNSHWAFFGTPYALKLVNKDSNNNGLYAGADLSLSGVDSDKGKMYAENSAVSTVWEMRAIDNSNVNQSLRSLPALNPQGSFSGEAPFYYLYANSNSLNNVDNGNCRVLQYDFKGVTAPSTVHLTSSDNELFVNETVTLTATASPNNKDVNNVTYLAIEQETSSNVWEAVGTAYEGSNVTNATKDAETGVVTVTYTFTPTGAATHNYRARAVIDNTDQFSTDAASAGGDGTPVTVTVNVRPIEVNSDNFTLILVDKAGNTLYTENNVSKNRVTAANEVSRINGDPLNNDWRSPLVTRYKYYNGTEEGKASAQAANNSNLVDWATYTGTTVYVGYEVSDAIDLNGGQFNSLNALMTEHVARGNGDNTKVRQASKFGKMYMLKFKTSEAYSLEDTHDKVDAETASGSYVYPYTNGDGPIYLYNDAIYQDTKDNGAATRTRYPWFLVSLNGDPYHVYVTSWQSSHSKADKSENFYSYLRTYYVNSTIGVVTNNVTDDPATEGGSLPTEYMILRGNGTYGDYKLVTTEEVNGSRQTVTSFEQYWRTNPTAQTTVGKEAGTALDASDRTTLTNSPYNWHEYAAYVNAKPETGGDKTYEKVNHWFMTVKVGDGSFDLVESNIDGVLVLLDNHGWEVMRKPIVARDDPDYEAVKAELKKFDSPMVSQYKFYSSRNADHKVYGYHKYDIVTNTGSKKPLAATTRVTTDSPVTSLANYPESMKDGALTDLYVTYDVKPEYANSYVGAATEAATQASSFYLRQGGKYAYADGTNVASSTSSENTDVYKWKLKPNFNIDAEMGYKYNDGTGNDEKSQEALETQYYNERRNGFDPYNLQLQNVSTNSYLTTNATTAALSSGVWTGDGTTANLQNLATRFTTTGYDSRVLSATNATFMAVQDANGNMRLMPRFDYGKVVEGFTTLKEQAAAQSAGNTTHAQTTLLSTPVTYHIIDNSGADVFGALTANTAGFAVPKEYRSPMVEEYFYHSSLEDAQNNRTTSNVTTVKPGDEVWVSYKAKEDFGSKDWIIYDTQDHFMHAVSRNLENNAANLWWMSNQNKDRASSEATSSLSTKTMPFLDNSFAWQFGNEGNTADPYNAKLYNKAAHWYVQQNANTTNNGRMDHLKPNITYATPYAIVYYNADESNGNAILYDRDHSRYVYYNNDEWQNNKESRQTTGELVFTQLPAISINIVDANKEVECTLEGFYNKNASWSTPFVPLYLERYAASGQKFYYDQACESAISEQVNDATVTANKAVYVSYTLDAAKWGTLDQTANTTIVMPSPTNNKVEWYSMVSNNKIFFIDGNNQLVSGSFKAGDDVDTNDNKKGQWALMGTPYNVKIVNRYAGSTSYLGIPSEINNNPIQLPATVQPEGTENVVDTWEVCQGMGNSGYVLQFRPQGSLSGQATYGYLGQDGNTNGKLGVTVNPNGNLQVKLTWKKETDAKIVTFKLFDREGNYMADEANGAIADAEIHGVSIGDGLASVFAHTNMQRRYCEYKFYSDAEMQTEVTNASDNLNETVYVKWDYTDDAPVFSQPGWDKRDYQYYMLGVWGFSNYNLMDVEGEGTTESPYTFKPNNTVGTPRDLKHQFALVGNPYGFKLYNRAADKDIKRNAALEITFADKEADGTTPTEEITFDLPIVSGSAYTSTETHFRSTKTGRYLSVTGTNENKSFSMTDNAGGYTRFRYIIVPVRVFKEGHTSWTDDTENDQKDYRMYALEMNPSGTARTTDARITTNDLRATGNAIGNARDFNHAFCNYTYYQKYDWNTSVSAPVPDGGLSYYGGKDQNKRQFIATYTVDQDAFDRLYYLDNSPNHDNAYSSKGAKSTSNAGSYTTLSDSRLSEVKADITDVYRWKFTGDPYDLQIHNVSMGEFADNYALAVKVPTETGATAPTEAAGTLVLLTEDLKTGDSDTESYGQYSHWEIIQRSDGHYLFWNIETPERYTYSLTSQADKLNKNKLYMTVPPFENGSTTVLNINQVEWNLVDVFNHYDVKWHVMEKTGETTYTEVANETKVVDENVTLTIEDLPTSVKRHFCDYEKMYSDAACTTEITEHTVNAATDIYVPYTLDSGAPNFYSGTPSSTIGNSYWYEIHYHEPYKYIFYDSNSNSISNRGDGEDSDGSSTTDVTKFTDYEQFRWVLVGSPYHVKFYHKTQEKYLTFSDDAVTLGTEGTSFELLDDYSGDFCAIYDSQTGMYLNASAEQSTNNVSYSGTSVDFTNAEGLVKITLLLHYSNKTQRMFDSNKDGQLDAYCKDANHVESIAIEGYQKKGRLLEEVLPLKWQRAFCKYSFYWDNSNSKETKSDTEVTAVNDDMVTMYWGGTTDIYVHVTYDFETKAPFKWSTADKEYTGKHWYYLVNNHRPNGELGKMVYRDSGPKLRVSTSLKENQLYLNNFEWCVIGDPYGFKMLNRYDPDQRYDEYLRVMESQDSHDDGLQIEQNSNDSQNIFEMMPGQYSYNFWMHPVYSDYIGEDEWDSDNDDVFNEYSYVGNNYNGSAAIIPNDQRSMTYLKTNSSANFRLEIQSDHTLSEYVKYAGFVGGLKYDKVTDAMRTDAADGDLTDDDKAAVRELVDDPENIVQMTQGYYRIVPYTQEGGSDGHKYIRGYLDDRERTGTGGYNSNLKVETQTAAEYDPASIFWFEGTTSDGTENGYPRYFIKTQGLSLDHTGLNAESNYKCRYENLGGAIAQIKIASLTGDMPHDYLSCTSTATETSTDQCFDEQAGQYKTRFYLQKVGEGGNELSFKLKLNAAFGKSYASLYVPFDVEIPADIDAKPFYGVEDHNYSANPKADDKYTLFCRTLDYINPDYGEKIIPAATPVVIKSDDAAAEISFKVLNNAPHPDAKLRGDLDENSERVNKISGIYLSIFDPRPELYTFGRENVYAGYKGETIDGKYTGRVGFFKRSTSALSKVLNPNRVFYISPFYNETQGSRGAAFVFEETPDIVTGVSDVGTGVHSHQYSDGAVYDLQGRKVADDYESALSNRHLLKGIYIINGKKVVIK